MKNATLYLKYMFLSTKIIHDWFKANVFLLRTAS